MIGTFNSGCAKLEIPIANRASKGPLGMVSPSNTYPGLTVKYAGSAPGEPNVYYPTGKRNYARVVWTDQFQGAADAHVREDEDEAQERLRPHGQGDVRERHRLDLQDQGGKTLGIKIKGTQGWDPNATSYESLANAIKSSGAQGVFLGGIVCLNGGKVIKDIRAVLGSEVPDPHARRVHAFLGDRPDVRQHRERRLHQLPGHPGQGAEGCRREVRRRRSRR